MKEPPSWETISFVYEKDKIAYKSFKIVIIRNWSAFPLEIIVGFQLLLYLQRW